MLNDGRDLLRTVGYYVLVWIAGICTGGLIYHWIAERV